MPNSVQGLHNCKEMIFVLGTYFQGGGGGEGRWKVEGSGLRFGFLRYFAVFLEKLFLYVEFGTLAVLIPETMLCKSVAQILLFLFLCAGS